ncbi:MAG: hypothetical protein ACOYM3_00910 [Terrimicrobiaceae bacterium]
MLPALAAVTGTASAGDISGKSSPQGEKPSIPIEVIDSAGGKLTRPIAHESEARLYISGSMKKWTGHHLPPAAHIDVELIGADGKVLAEVRDTIKSSGALREARGGRYSSYVASFPIAQAKEAVRIRVRYHQQNHTGQ